MAQAKAIFGITISDMTCDIALARFRQAVDARQHTKIAFCNAHTANLAYGDNPFQKALSQFTILADGIGVDLAARILHGQSFAANLNGTDFIPRLINQFERPISIAMIGSEPGVALRARDSLQMANPHHAFPFVLHGFATRDETEAFLTGLEKNPVDMLLVAMGNPRQELFIAKDIAAKHATLAIGVGALFDFIAGEVPRAPVWVRNLRLEWLFRLMQEPRRLFQRYVLGNPLFLWRVVLARFGLGNG